MPSAAALDVQNMPPLAGSAAARLRLKPTVMMQLRATATTRSIAMSDWGMLLTRSHLPEYLAVYQSRGTGSCSQDSRRA